MSNLLASDAKILSDNAVIAATQVATKTFTDATQQAVNAAALTGAYNVSVAVPGGIDLDTVTKLFQGLGYTLQYLTNQTQLTLDWQNPNVQNTIVSTANNQTIFPPAP